MFRNRKFYQCTLQFHRRQLGSSVSACWNCQTQIVQGQIICPKCNALRKLNTKPPNYFDLFQIDQKFSVDLQKLHVNFRNLQAVVHPDKYSNHSHEEQKSSADWSSLLNKAYTTLQHPIKRGEYMLRVQNVEIPEKNETVNPEFLMEMMERNEEVAELQTQSAIEDYTEVLQKEFKGLCDKLADELDHGSCSNALEVLVRMRYTNNLIVKLKEKLYDLNTQ